MIKIELISIQEYSINNLLVEISHNMSADKRLNSSIPRTNVRRESLERPSCLRQNSNLQNIQTSDQASQEMNKKIDQILRLINGLSDAVANLRDSVDGLEARQAVLNTTFENLETSIQNINTRLVRIDRTTVQPNAMFSQQMIDDAREQLGLDLTVDLTYNGVHLLNTPFQNTNINLFGTKLLDVLFSKEELSKGSVEPTKKTTSSLDQRRIDLIKICYLKKLRTIETFNEYWPLIVRSLKQKCLDSRRTCKKASNVEDTEDEWERMTNNESCEPKEGNDRSDDQGRACLPRDSTMHSLDSI